MSLTIPAADEDALLFTAREAITARLQGRKPVWPSYSTHAEGQYGAFVTLHKTATLGRRLLRGCIGMMSSSLPLHETVRDMALAAAFEDPRFPVLAAIELVSIEIEISVLSPFEPCTSDDIIPGEHGVYLTRGSHSGVFLPQVATEQGWNQDELLEQLCVKAKIESGAYKTAGTNLYRFTATIFSELNRARS